MAHTKDPRAVTGQGAGRRARGCGCPTPGGFETHPYGDGWCGDGMPGSVTAGRLMVLARGVNIGRWPIDSGTGPLSVSLTANPVRSLPVGRPTPGENEVAEGGRGNGAGRSSSTAFPIGSSPFAVTGGASTASVSTIGGACVLSGRTEARWRSKLPTTTEEER